MINRVLNSKNDYEYYRELSFFMASLKDGHTLVWRYPNVNRYTTVYKGYYVDFGRIEGKIIVTRINTSKKDSIPLGSELLEVNGLSPEEYLSKFVIPYISASTDQSRNEQAAFFIFDGLAGMEYSIKIKTPNNEIIALKLVHGRLGEKFPPSTIPEIIKRDPVEFKWLDNRIAYLALNSLEDSMILNAFKKLLPELYKAEKLIIDMRENSGGNSEIGDEILKYLCNDKYLLIHNSRSRMHIAHAKRNGAYISANDTIGSEWKEEAFLDYHNMRYTTDEYEPKLNDLKAKRIIVPTLVLIGHKTVSAAEDFLVPLRNIKHIKTMGEITAGSAGTPYEIPLPGSSAYICVLQSYYPDGKKFVGVGITPDIEVKRTILGIINMQDEVLNRAIQYLNQK